MVVKVLKKLIFCLFATMVSVAILSCFVFVYHNSGVHISSSSGSTDYTWEPYQTKNTMTEGYAFLHMDSNGFNNIDTSNDSIDILLMGSSQMEAINVPQNQNTASVLNSLFSEIYTYNIGISGHDIYHCFNNIEKALAEFKPTKAVIIVTDDIVLNMENMHLVIEGQYSKIPSYDKGLLYIIQKNVPAIKEIYKSISDWRSVETNQIQTGETIGQIDNEYVEILNRFLILGKDAAEESGCRLIIVYQPTTSIDHSGNYVVRPEDNFRAVFAEICETNNIFFLDMTEPFEKMYNEKHILAHGFINTAVGAGHLNKYGHAIIAEELARLIRENIE